VLAALGAGALISSVAFELIAETDGLTSQELALWMYIGVAIFLGGDYLVERKFGSEGAGASMGIIVGSVVDGIPESVIFGIQVATDYPISFAFLVAVWVSNVPQAWAPSADLSASGWSARRIGLLWGVVVLACGVASDRACCRRRARAASRLSAGRRARRSSRTDATASPRRRFARWMGLSGSSCLVTATPRSSRGSCPSTPAPSTASTSTSLPCTPAG
jgi:hypothetical protein